MTKINHKQLVSWLLFALALCVARGIRELSVSQEMPIPTILGLLQTFLYVGLIAVWCISVRRRIVQPQICVILEWISALMLFWHLTRGLKYHVVAWFVGEGWMLRYLWYLYYLPLLLIPALLIMIAVTLREPESYRLPKKTVSILFSVSTLLFLCVITNDLHQLVFAFPADAVVFTTNEYTHNILYYFCFAWIVGGSVTFFTVTLKSCRLPNKKFLWLPVVPIAACVVYSTAYVFFNGMRPAWDFTTMFTFSLIILFEVAILVGLVPSNSQYTELFRASDRSSFITDGDLNIVYASKNAEPIERETMQRVIEEGSVTQEGKRIRCSRISGGYIFWKDDITELLEINEILEGTRDELAGYGSLLEEENKQKRRHQKLIQQQSLSESIRQKTAPQQRLLSDMAQRLQETTDRRQAEALLHRITVIGAYIKRRSNLCLLASKSDSVPLSEVELCIKESITYLQLSGVTAAAQFALSGRISGETAGKLYDFFENAVELSLYTLKAITVLTDSRENGVVLNMMVDCASDLNMLKINCPESEIKHDGSTWFCSLRLRGGEGA